MTELREALGVETLRGIDTDVLEPPSNVVRVFISSTISGWDLTDKLLSSVAGNFFKKHENFFSYVQIS